eukprot:5670811-Pyramimonas_sp.AAC.1
MGTVPHPSRRSICTQRVFTKKTTYPAQRIYADENEAVCRPDPDPRWWRDYAAFTLLTWINISRQNLILHAKLAAVASTEYVGQILNNTNSENTRMLHRMRSANVIRLQILSSP